MIAFLFIFERGNGYRCHCCRHTWETSEVREFTCAAEAEVEAQKINDAFSALEDESDVRVKQVFALATPTPVFNV